MENRPRDVVIFLCSQVVEPVTREQRAQMAGELEEIWIGIPCLSSFHPSLLSSLAGELSTPWMAQSVRLSPLTQRAVAALSLSLLARSRNGDDKCEQIHRSAGSEKREGKGNDGGDEAMTDERTEETLNLHHQHLFYEENVYNSWRRVLKCHWVSQIGADISAAPGQWRFAGA